MFRLRLTSFLGESWGVCKRCAKPTLNVYTCSSPDGTLSLSDARSNKKKVPHHQFIVNALGHVCQSQHLLSVSKLPTTSSHIPRQDFAPSTDTFNETSSETHNLAEACKRRRTAGVSAFPKFPGIIRLLQAIYYRIILYSLGSMTASFSYKSLYAWRAGVIRCSTANAEDASLQQLATGVLIALAVLCTANGASYSSTQRTPYIVSRYFVIFRCERMPLNFPGVEWPVLQTHVIESDRVVYSARPLTPRKMPQPSMSV